MKPENIKNLIPEELQKELSEDSLGLIAKEFETLLESAVADRVDIAVKTAESNFDEEVSKRLVKLVEKLDEAHKIGLQQVINKLNEGYNTKLSAVRNYYKTKLNESKAKSKTITERYNGNIEKVRNYYKNIVAKESKTFKNTLVESISLFLDDKIENAMPTKDLNKALKNNTSMKLVESLKKMLSVDEIVNNDVIREPILEGKRIIEVGKKQRNILRRNNNKLLQENKELKRAMLIESKLSGLPEDTKMHLRKVLQGGDSKFINENFEYALSLFKQKKATDRETLAERTRKKHFRKNVNESKQGVARNISRRRLVKRRKPLTESNDIRTKNDVDNLIDNLEIDI